MRENQKENLTVNDAAGQIGRLLKTLHRVDAPTDFNARVMARIAAAKTDGSAGLFKWFTRIAVPVAAVVAIVFAVWFARTPAPGDLNVAVAVPENRPTVLPTIDVAVPTSQTIPDQRVADASPKPKAQPNQTERSPDVRPRSRDFAITEGTSKSPQPDSNSNAAGFSTPAVIMIDDVLSNLGVETDESGDKLVVRSVRPNSVAERSGVRIGDRIEAIDEKRVTKKTRFVSKVAGRTLTVARNGARVVVTLN